MGDARLAEEERRQGWGRLSPLFAEHSRKILGIVIVAVLAAAWTVFWNGLIIPSKLSAVQVQRAEDHEEMRRIRSLVDSVADVVFWQGGLSCSDIQRNREAWAASLKQCGIIASRTNAVFPAPTERVR